MRNVLLLLMLLSLATFSACDEPAKPKRPPADSVSDTDADDPRERRRNASDDRDPSVNEDDRYGDTGTREERRRPPIGDRESSAAEEAEDERDADADRPVSSRKD